MRYKVTLEIKTPWWLKLLRFFRIKEKRTDFELELNNPYLIADDILFAGEGGSLKIVEKL
jgi:hypothetical protein